MRYTVREHPSGRYGVWDTLYSQFVFTGLTQGEAREIADQNNKASHDRDRY